jgi:hypothetical protein
MKETIKKGIFVKNIVIWGVIGCCCIIALGVFVKSFIEDKAAGKDIFIPGILVLVVAVSCLLVYSITRVKKYVGRLKE